MRVVRHRLQGARFEKSSHGGREIEPKFIVMHYTAGGSMDSSLRAVNNVGLSAHLFVDRDGGIVQTVPFNQAAFHAGVSAWRGFSGLNQHSIGIEICNLGFLDIHTSSGWTRAGLGRSLADDQVSVARHKNGGRNMAWEIYPQQQHNALAELVLALREAYPSVQEIVGHEDIAPTRKVDPGPAFPIGRFQTLSGGASGSGSLAHDDLGEYEVRVRTSLNLRGGPGTHFAVVGSLGNGTRLRALFERDEWLAVDLQSDGIADGFAHGDFLRRIGA